MICCHKSAAMDTWKIKGENDKPGTFAMVRMSEMINSVF